MTGGDGAGGSDGAQALVAVGRIGRPRGVRGECFVEPWTDAPEERFAVGVVLRTDPPGSGPLTVEAVNTASARLTVRFAGVGSREAAETLRGTRLLLAARERPVLHDPDDFYDSDLIGLQAVTTDGAPLGVVADVLHAGGADYLVLKLPADAEGGPPEQREQLVPFVRAIVPEVDLATGRVVIDAPDGLFDV